MIDDVEPAEEVSTSAEAEETKTVQKEMCPPIILSMVRKAAQRMQAAQQQAEVAQLHFQAICMAANEELGLTIPGEQVDLDTGEVVRVKPDSVAP